MNFINNMKITHRLLALLAVLMVGLASIAATFYYFETQQASSIGKQQSYLSFSMNAEKAKGSLLGAIRYEQLFLAENDQSHIATHQQFLQEARDNVARMKQQSLDGEFTAQITEIEAELKAYEKTVENVFTSAIALGYGVDENAGSVGEMRQYVHSIEGILKEVNLENLIVSMLMMRRHEKDFQIRENNKYLERMSATSEKFISQIERSKISRTKKLELQELLTQYLGVFTNIVTGTNERNKHEASSQVIVNSVQPMVELLVSQAEARVKQVQSRGEQILNYLNWMFASVLFLISAVMIGAMILLAKSINNPISSFLRVINDLTSGDSDARVKRESTDELGDLGRAFDYMLNERQQAARVKEQEAEDLNDSIISLMEAAADLSERDFTVKVPVSENITGTVSDALNMMTNRVSKVLKNIQNISQEVKHSANTVHEQGQTVTLLAAEERNEVERTMSALAEASESMNDISELAQHCRKIAEGASESTGGALDQVLETAIGINEIRSTISETEKRIKRLGERSQEISSVVEIINNVAIQTQVLALNASMQAAAAGEAGRGFSVVADEVQRLAKSSRESTSEISSLVSNIQSETSETMAAMNRAISQVIEGTKMAEKSGERMRETQKTTSELVSVVAEVAKSADIQAKVSNRLKEESLRIAESTEKTSEQLMKQSEVTGLLVVDSDKLSESVAEFKLQA